MTDAETIAQLRRDLEGAKAEIGRLEAAWSRWQRLWQESQARCAELEKALRVADETRRLMAKWARSCARDIERDHPGWASDWREFSANALSATPLTPKWVQCTTVSNACLGGCASAREHEAYIQATPLTREEEPKCGHDIQVPDTGRLYVFWVCALPKGHGGSHSKATPQEDEG